MAKGNSTFNISLKLLDKNFKQGLSNIQKQIRGLGNFVKGAFALGSITAFGRQMIQVATDFEDAMARVRAVSNASADDLKMMSDEARKMGATTRYTATEAAGALENLTRNGMTATQATQALSGTMKFAQANAIGLAESADIVSNTLNMFGLNAQETTRVSDVLSSVASTTATNVSEIYAALVNAAPAAKALGISLEETSAAIGALAQRGVKAEQAGTALRTALTKMVDPKIVAKMNDMGVAVDEQVIKQEGLIGVVKRLGDANLSTADLVTIFSQRGAIGIRQLIDAYDDLVLEMEITKNSAGVTARMFNQGVGTTRAAIDTLKSTYEAFLESLGSKSNVVFTGIVNFLTKLIKNFDTLGGTLLNIASVVVPLMTKKIVILATSWSTFTKKAIAEAAALKVAMGDWITLIATAVTWLITGLVANMPKFNKQINDLNKELDKSSAEFDRMRTRVDTLVSRLGTTTDKKTLAGVVATLTEMFPDFKQQITETAAEAGKTGNYTKLKNILNDIVGLQEQMRRSKILDDLIIAYDEKVKNKLENGAVGNTSGYAQYTNYEQFEDLLEKGIKERERLNDKGAKQLAETIKTQVREVFLTSENQYTAANEIQRLVKDYIDITQSTNQKIIGGMTREALADPDIAAARDAVNRRIHISGKIQDQQNKLTQNTVTTTQSVNDNLEEVETETKKTKTHIKTTEEKIQDIADEFDNSMSQVDDDLKWGINGVTTWGDYAQKVYEIWVKAYNDFRNLTGKSGVDNDYFVGMTIAGVHRQDPEFYNPRAATKIEPPKNSDFADKNRVVDTTPQGLKTDRARATEPIKDWMVYADDAITSTSNFTNALSSLQSAFNTLSSADASWIDRLAAASRIMETMEDTVFGAIKLINQLGDAELLASKKEAIAAALGLKWKKKEVAADTTKAVTGAAASQSSIPVVGPLLAIGAVATILALIAASSQKFAKGGIVQGSSKYGDKLLARVNAGEAILNQSQQKRLLDIADGRAAAIGGEVRLVAHGQDLVGVWRNINKANSRISGSKGM